MYRLTRHIRGRALLISNTGYQALKLLKNLFEQIQFRIGIYTERNTDVSFSLLFSQKSSVTKGYFLHHLLCDVN